MNTHFTASTVTRKGDVRAWQELVTIPTYAIGKEEKNPIFLEKRVYQGSSGSVYPYPVVEKIYDTKEDKTYKAYFLENYYIKVMILPELGGRVQMAYDKIHKRHFVYFNEVIKPALVGLTGPWISGGIEFNWPQHHRPSTFLPVDAQIEQNADGSVTVWCSEIERMCRTKGAQGFTLYPDKAYLAIKVRLYNRTPFPQTFLWWANPAVVVNDHYYSVFPPDVNAVFDHGKRAVTEFPISHGVYYKYNYAPGTDISRYKNIPVPTSYMAVLSKFDFVGGYEEHVQGGLLHVANHHISPGKKQWTWGNGDFGQAWDRNLTDKNGPYIELMTGVYCDNQPDFSWLQPYEEKTWTQYFMPYSQVGYVRNASKDVLLGLDIKDNAAVLKVYATGQATLRIVLTDTAGTVLIDETADLSPESVFEKKVTLSDPTPDNYIAKVFDTTGKCILQYQPHTNTERAIPDPAKPAKEPKDIASQEQLYLTGLHLEQYRHATYNPMDYYMEALRREPGDIRCNNAVGLLLLRSGKFQEAEHYLRAAIDTLTERNPNPYDGEPYYNLGVCLKWQGRTDEAYDVFYKATWNAAQQDAAYYAIAQIDMLRGDYEDALDDVERSLSKNWHSLKARQLKASILRKMGRTADALTFIEDSLRIDSFNVGCLWEKYLLTNDTAIIDLMHTAMRGTAHDYIEYAFDFMSSGLWEEAARLLHVYTDSTTEIYPIVLYALGYAAEMQGHTDEAVSLYRQAEIADPAYCFPNRPEEVILLSHATALNPMGAKAYYYLGNFYYSKKQYAEAIDMWEKSAAIDNTFPTVLRNLALAYYNKRNDKQHALQMMEQAFHLDETDSRIFMELVQLYKRLGYTYQQRLDILDKYSSLTQQRDDLMIEYVQLHNQLLRYPEAKDLLAHRHFHPWEGGEGKVTGQYTLCRRELAKHALATGDGQKALDLLMETDSYPHNLGEGKLITMQENDIDYYKGLALKALGETDKANAFFRSATQGDSEPQQAFYYNDSQPDKIYYQALAWQQLGDNARADELFERLLQHGQRHLSDICKIDYFAVSLPELAIWDDDLNIRNQIHCHFVMGLGYLGKGDLTKAQTEFQTVLDLDINHQQAQILLYDITNGN